MSLDDRAERELASVTPLNARTGIPAVRFLSAGKLLEQPAPTQWLVQNILPCGSLATMIGAPGSFKSSIALDIAASVACGIEWHGRRTRKGAVFYIAGEGQHGINRRLKAWSIMRSDELSTAPLFVSSGAVSLIDPLNAASVSAEVQRIATTTDVKPELVVIDTLARNFGPGDENSARDIGQFVANLDTHIRELFGCSILTAHHSGVIDSGRARGSSALRAAIDTEMMCERSERTVILRCTKQKDAAEFEPISFEARVVELPWKDVDGASETACVIFRATSDAFVRTSKLGRNERKAYDELLALYDEHRERLTKSGHDPKSALVKIADWRSRCGLDRKRWSEAQSSLESRHLIVLEHPHVVLP